MEYGGADVTQAFQWLLKKSAFPYKDYDERQPQEAILLKELKERFCHVNLVRNLTRPIVTRSRFRQISANLGKFLQISSNFIKFHLNSSFNSSNYQDICGPAEKEFIIDHRNKPKWKFTLQIGDECIIAPLSLFHTELLNITGTGKIARTQKPAVQQADPEDCFDAEYLRETGVIHDSKHIIFA